MRVYLSGDARRVQLGAPPGWSERFPVEMLPGKLAFYKGLRDRKGGQFARFYAETVEQLEKAVAKARAAGTL